MKNFLIIAAIFGLTSCAKDPVQVSSTNNKDINVSLLFEYDGCKVYRFNDEGYKYFTNCQRVEWEESYQCGKSRCYRKRSVQNGAN